MIVFGAYKAIESYTNHGETITVPNLAELEIEEVEELLAQQNLRYKIYDSTYILGQAPHTVVSQDPKPLSKVKENRRIYITINSINPPKVEMPDLKDMSLEQAKLVLGSKDLSAGSLTYQPGLGRNTILGATFEGKPLEVGEEIFKGSKIDLILANGYGTAKVTIPDLYGLTLNEAEFVLQGSYLNVGGVDYQQAVVDKGTAVIYKQIPSPNEDIMLNYGEAVDLFLTNDLSIYPKDTLE